MVTVGFTMSFSWHLEHLHFSRPHHTLRHAFLFSPRHGGGLPHDSGGHALEASDLAGLVGLMARACHIRAQVPTGVQSLQILHVILVITQVIAIVILPRSLHEEATSMARGGGGVVGGGGGFHKPVERHFKQDLIQVHGLTRTH